MAGKIRIERVRSQIRTEVARILQTELKDPRAGFITVVKVDVSGDLRYAKIYVSVMENTDGKVRAAMHMLERAAGFVQRQLGNRMHVRVTPQLTFILDESSEHAIKISAVLNDLAREREEREAALAEKASDSDSETEQGDVAESAEEAAQESPAE
ncbi:30S ribosome-binding factor RbfA [Planctomycetota bacterium]|nr:30S ribosome-binding factor RbfA [Planctomycetota bacterium]